jgi:hypothetical protein
MGVLATFGVTIAIKESTGLMITTLTTTRSQEQ